MEIFKSLENQQKIIKVIDNFVRQNLKVSLNKDFNERIFRDIYNFVYSKFGNNTSNISGEEHLNNLNRVCFDESIKYIKENISHFPKLQIPTPSGQNALVPFVDQNQNLFKNTNSLFTQSQNQNQMNSMMNPNFASHDTNNPNTESALANLIAQRHQDAPRMTDPRIVQQNQNPNVNGQWNQGFGVSGSDGDPTLMKIVLQHPIAIQNPASVPYIINEIKSMPHLMDQMVKQPQLFYQQISQPHFIQMIFQQIKNKNDPNMKPMNMNMNMNDKPADSSDIPAPVQSPGQAHGPSQAMSEAEFMKRIQGFNPGQGVLQNGMNIYIPPSQKLINNCLPDLDQVHLIDYQLSLDFRNDLETSSKNRYLVRFNQYGNVSKINLTSCLISENDYLASQPYIYIKIEELGGRCFTSNGDQVFGKLILVEKNNGYLHYRPDFDSCVQYFSQPQAFGKFTISFLNNSGKYLDLKEVVIKKSLKLKKQGKLKFITEYRHGLEAHDVVEIHIYRKREIDSYQVQVEDVIDEYTFTVENSFEVLTDKIKILKNKVECGLSFKFHEINWNLLTNRTIQNAQLIKLSELVKSSKKVPSHQKQGNQGIINHVNQRLNPPPAQPQRQTQTQAVPSQFLLTNHT